MNRLLPYATLGLGLILGCLAFPRLGGQIALLPGNTATDKILSGDVLTESGYERAVSSREAALGWSGQPETRIELGGIFYYMAQVPRAHSTSVEDALSQSRAALERGLAEAPVDTYAWLWLVDERLAADDQPGAAAALRQCLLSSPYEPLLAPARALLAFRLWPLLDSRAQQLAAADAGVALQGSDGDEFVRRINRSRRLDLLRMAIAENWEAGQKLQAILKKNNLS